MIMVSRDFEDKYRKTLTSPHDLEKYSSWVRYMNYIIHSSWPHGATLSLAYSKVLLGFPCPITMKVHTKSRSHLRPLHTWAKSRDLVMVRTLWLSSKGRTNGVGKAVLCSHGPSRIVWSENGPCCRTMACFVGGLRGEDFGLIWYLSNSINLGELFWWCLYVLESILEPIMKCALQSIMKFVLLEDFFLNNGLPYFASGPPPRVGLDENSRRPWNLILSPPCKTQCRL